MVSLSLGNWNLRPGAGSLTESHWQAGSWFLIPAGPSTGPPEFGRSQSRWGTGPVYLPHWHTQWPPLPLSGTASGHPGREPNVVVHASELQVCFSFKAKSVSFAQRIFVYAFQHRSAEPIETGWLVTRVAKSCSTSFFPEPQ